ARAPLRQAALPKGRLTYRPSALARDSAPARCRARRSRARIPSSCCGLRIAMFHSRMKLAAYAAIILIGCAIAAPNLLTPAQRAGLPAWLPKQQVTLGLDLRGGSHLVFEVDSAALASDQVDLLADRVRAALRDEQISDATVIRLPDSVAVRIADPVRRAAGERILRGLVSTVSLSRLAEVQRDLDVKTLPDATITLRPTEAALMAPRAPAVEQSPEIRRRPIDAPGVAEPTVQRLGPDRILVQVPGLQDPAQIRTVVRSTAKLTFHRVLNRPAAAGHVPSGYQALPADKGDASIVIERQPMLQGERLTDAAANF